MTLAEFLLARIAEDEAVARAAAEDPGAGPYALGRDWAGFDALAREHVERHAPHRVLVECEAKRRIVQRLDVGEWEWEVAHSLATAGASSVLDEILRLLALPYADHPDYREEWSP